MTQSRKQTAVAEQEDAEWVSLRTAAALIGRNREAVLQLAIKGLIKVDNRGRWTFVSRDSIDRYLATLPAPAAV